MNNRSVIRLFYEASQILDHPYDSAALHFVEINNRTYLKEEFDELKSDLIESGSKIKMLLSEQRIPATALSRFASDTEAVLLVFKDDDLTPLIIHRQKKAMVVLAVEEEQTSTSYFADLNIDSLHRDSSGEIIAFVLLPFESVANEYSIDGHPSPLPLSPVKRFFNLLSAERRDIFYILIYSILIGLTGLILPVGIQNTVQLISGGVFFSSIYILIGAVILGVLISGVLQIVQITLVEYLQRRVFAKAALEFAYRIPRIKMEALQNKYAPELINRFFDVITLQKGLPKLLIDLTSSAIQILFGLILLSLYHPFFVVFGLALVIILLLIFSFTGQSGLRSSINESKYKYKVAQWLEELARALNSFKLAGNTDLPTRKADHAISDYLKYRKAHFKVLVTQFSFIIFFKTAVIGSVLIIGTKLVIGREITLGQFVAAEVIIILLMNALEKVITYMDVVYDLLTAVDKIAQVTDLPLEKLGGLDFPKRTDSGYAIDIKQLRYKYADNVPNALNGIDLSIKPGEKVCISGPGNSGKTTLTNLIAGMHSDFGGIITINNYSLRDLDIRHMRDRIAKNISPEDLFDGTILENITLGSATRSVDDALNAIRKVGLQDDINRLPQGLSTHILSGGKGFSTSFIHRLILARCLAKKPSLLILNDFFSGLKKQDKLELLQSVISKNDHWTMIAVSNDPLIMAACDRVVILHAGMIDDEGTFEELLNKGTIANYVE